MGNKSHDRTVPTPPELREYVVALVNELGTRHAAERLGLSQSATMRVALGEPALRGTLAIVRESKGRDAA